MMFFRILILVAIIAVALSVGLYFGLQDNSSGKNSTETGTWLNQLPLPDDTENDTITDDKENDANESDEEKKPDADNAEAQVDPVVETTKKTATTTTAKATTTTTTTTATTTTTTPSVVVENVGSVIAPRKYGCFSGSEIPPTMEPVGMKLNSRGNSRLFFLQAKASVSANFSNNTFWGIS